MTQTEDRADVLVVGGGLAGLAAAAYVARSGLSAIVCERAPSLGGRAATHGTDAFRFNLGPHALYRAGHARAVLAELGVAYSGGGPRASGGIAVDRGVAHALPGGFFSLVTTGLFGLGAKFEAARFTGALAGIDPEPLQGVPVEKWCESTIDNGEVRRLAMALIRLTSYANDPARMSAGTAIAQMQMALKSGVSYLDDGWQTLVDGLRAVAVAAGARVLTAARVNAVEDDGRRRRVRLAGGETVLADAVIITGPPHAAAAMVTGPGSDALRGWAEAAVPVRTACLDVGLSRLPRPHVTFALGIDRPLYFSVHSAVARLAPAGGALIHVAKYLDGRTDDVKADERDLEVLLDLLQPGWREAVVERRFLPNMAVANWLPTAASGGTAGRPGPEVPGADNLFVAGDWVGPEGLLADASLASARRAARLAVRHCQPATAAA